MKKSMKKSMKKNMKKNMQQSRKPTGNKHGGALSFQIFPPSLLSFFPPSFYFPSVTPFIFPSFPLFLIRFFPPSLIPPSFLPSFHSCSRPDGGR